MSDSLIDQHLLILLCLMDILNIVCKISVALIIFVFLECKVVLFFSN